MAHKPSPNALISREFFNLRRKPRSNYFQVHDCVKNDVTKWEVFIIGPPGTSYANGVYRAVMRFPNAYPMEPPSIQFSCSMYHPNIYRDGKVCISTLQCPPRGDAHVNSSEYWRPVLGAEQALLSVVSLLSDPNVNDPANQYAAQDWIANRASFDKKCAKFAVQSRKSVPADFIAPVVAHAQQNPPEATPAASSSSSSSSTAARNASAPRALGSAEMQPATAGAAAEGEEDELEYVYSDEEDGENWNMGGEDDETDGGNGPRSVEGSFDADPNSNSGTDHVKPEAKQESAENEDGEEEVDALEAGKRVREGKQARAVTPLSAKRKRSSTDSLSLEEAQSAGPVSTTPNSADSAVASPLPDQVVQLKHSIKRRKSDTL